MGIPAREKAVQSPWAKDVSDDFQTLQGQVIKKKKEGKKERKIRKDKDKRKGNSCRADEAGASPHL